MLTMLVLFLAALVTSTISAMIGMAGGIILLAIMLLFLPVEIVIPVHAAVQLISNGTRTVVFVKHVQWRAWGFFCAPAIVGIFFGRELFTALDPTHLRFVIAGFILIAIHLPRSKKGTPWPEWTFAIAGALAGTLGMLVGATGPIIAPFFLRANILKEELVATKALAQMAVHILKVIAFGTIGFAFSEHWKLILLLGIAVMIGTNLGEKLLKRISERLFVLFFKTALTAIAIKLLIWG